MYAAELRLAISVYAYGHASSKEPAVRLALNILLK